MELLKLILHTSVDISLIDRLKCDKFAYSNSGYTLTFSVPLFITLY